MNLAAALTINHSDVLCTIFEIIWIVAGVLALLSFIFRWGPYKPTTWGGPYSAYGPLVIFVVFLVLWLVLC